MSNTSISIFKLFEGMISYEIILLFHVVGAFLSGGKGH